MRLSISIFLLLSSVLSVHGRLGGIISHPKLLDHRSEEEDSFLKDEYIVVLDDKTEDVENALKELVASSGGEIQYVYKSIFKGGLIRAMPKFRLVSLLDNVVVKFASPNMVVKIDGIQQKDTPWGLDRIDQETSGGDGVFKYAYDGSGVDVYIIDSGIQLDHEEFEGRATCGFSSVDESNCVDGNGHGTHVAGIVGGKTYGVAKNSRLISVKVFGDDGRSSDAVILAGVDYVIEQKKQNPNKSMVINMSLGGIRSTASNDAVNAAVDAGIVTVVAAGNEHRNACWVSPASAEKVITVGSITERDRRSSFSNVGPCVDIFAPGSDIESSYPEPGTTTGTESLSGTSMASPFVAGVAAMHLQKSPGSTPEQVWSAIQNDATRDFIQFGWIFGRRRRSPNLLLNTKSLQ